MNDANLLTMDNVSVNYAGNKSVGVNDIDLTIHAGEYTAIIGSSGSGKSTLLRLMAGLTQSTLGQIDYAGKPLVGINEQAKIVFQNYALLPWLSVFDNVELGLANKTIEPAKRREAVNAMIESIGLEDFAEAYPSELSGGMCQRVGFARALVAKPELLLLDEAFSALDALTSRHLRAELMGKWSSGSMPAKAIVMVTHDVGEALDMADRILILTGQPGMITHEIVVKDYAHEPKLELIDRIYELMR